MSGFLYLLPESILQMIIVWHLCMVRLRGILLLVVTTSYTRYTFPKLNQISLVLPLLRYVFWMVLYFNSGFVSVLQFFGDFLVHIDIFPLALIGLTFIIFVYLHLLLDILSCIHQVCLDCVFRAFNEVLLFI